MVYLRTKTVKGEQYLYLVRSVWDANRSSSRQEIIKYLGKASDVTKSDIPKQHRSVPRVVSFFRSHKFLKNKKLIAKFQKKLYKFLKDGDLDYSFDLYNEYKKYSDTATFFDQILKPVMYKVGDLWEAKKITVADEHVCSNTAFNLVAMIMNQNAFSDKKGKILLCTPSGEEHHLGCKILESFFVCENYTVFYLAPYVPSESLITFIEKNNPDIILVSVTLEENLKTAQRLVRKIKNSFNIEVLIGGQALASNHRMKFGGTLVDESSLKSIAKIVSNILKNK